MANNTFEIIYVGRHLQGNKRHLRATQWYYCAWTETTPMNRLYFGSIKFVCATKKNTSLWRASPGPKWHSFYQYIDNTVERKWFSIKLNLCRAEFTLVKLNMYQYFPCFLNTSAHIIKIILRTRQRATYPAYTRLYNKFQPLMPGYPKAWWVFNLSGTMLPQKQSG